MLTAAPAKWLSITSLLYLLASPAIALETLTLKTETHSQAIHLDGTVEAIRKSTVAAQTAGTISAIYYDVNDSVQPGSVLLQISDSEQQARLEQAQAASKAAQANLKDAEQNFNRIRGIYKKHLASQAQFDQAKNQLDGAKASYRQANAALKEAQKQVSYTKVIAPYGGVVTQRHVEQGEVVAPGSPLMSGIDLEQLRVNVNLPQKYAEGVRKHQLAEILLPNNQVIPAQSLTIYPYADAKTHNFQVRIDLPKNQPNLYPGMMVKVSVPISSYQSISIPKQALIVRSELRAVYVLDQKNQPQLRQVRIGKQDQHKVEILSGLLSGDRIALDPNQALKEINTARANSDA